MEAIIGENMTQDWQSDLDNFFAKLEDTETKTQLQQDKEQAGENIIFFKSVVMQAFNEVRAALELHGRQVMVHLGRDSASIVVRFNDVEELNYSITTSGLRVFPEIRSIDISSGKRILREGVFRDGTQDYSIADISKDELITHCLDAYKSGINNPQQQSS
ncbi:MAG: hypothetical protein ABI700_12715 [Chloroflexota bacterium]